jgi:phage shock protein C
LSDHLAIRVIWLRLGFIFFLLASHFWLAAGVYFLMACCMQPAKTVKGESRACGKRARGACGHGEEKRYSTARAISLLRQRFESLERRIRRMESRVTSREYEWDRKLYRNRG